MDNNRKMPRYSALLAQDTRGTLRYTWYKIWLGYLLRPISTLCSRYRAWSWGVQMGPGCRFYGLTQFVRTPGSVIQIGERCRFRSAFISNGIGLNRRCFISTYHRDASIVIGAQSGFSGTVIAARQSVSVGRQVHCGANVTITDFDWHAVDPEGRLGGAHSACAPVVIEDNVWLGLNVIVLKGVEIGENTVVAAGSVVTGSIPPGVLAGGCPAVIIRELDA